MERQHTKPGELNDKAFNIRSFLAYYILVCADEARDPLAALSGEEFHFAQDFQAVLANAVDKKA